MTGTRRDVEPHLLAPGEYGCWDGVWYGVPPSATEENPLLANLSKHQVVEEPGGTITVSPSILVTRSGNALTGKGWHGYLEKGVWREANG